MLGKNCSNVEKGFKMVGCRISKFSLRCTNNGVFSNEKLSPPQNLPVMLAKVTILLLIYLFAPRKTAALTLFY